MSSGHKTILLPMLCLGLALHLFPGCSSVKVKRTDAAKKTDLSGSWNDTDSRLVAEEMVKDCLAKPWVGAFQATRNTQPAVIVGTVINKTSEHIDASTFIKNLEKNLLDSGTVKFVAAKQERQEIREERADQQANASPETAKPSRKETGAYFMLQGTISSIKDEVKGKYAIYYQVSLELINMATNEKAWIGQKEIKKIVSRSAFGL